MKRSSVRANDDSEDESLWDVKPKKKVFLSNSNISKSKSVKLKGKRDSKASTTIKNGKGKKNAKDSAGKKVEPCGTPAKSKHEGHCPFCQMPFSLLVLESPRCHATQCMDLPLKTDKGKNEGKGQATQ